jgi:hypothetical protein
MRRKYTGPIVILGAADRRRRILDSREEEGIRGERRLMEEAEKAREAIGPIPKSFDARVKLLNELTKKAIAIARGQKEEARVQNRLGLELIADAREQKRAHLTAEDKIENYTDHEIIEGAHLDGHRKELQERYMETAVKLREFALQKETIIPALMDITVLLTEERRERLQSSYTAEIEKAKAAVMPFCEGNEREAELQAKSLPTTTNLSTRMLRLGHCSNSHAIKTTKRGRPCALFRSVDFDSVTNSAVLLLSELSKPI